MMRLGLGCVPLALLAAVAAAPAPASELVQDANVRLLSLKVNGKARHCSRIAAPTVAVAVFSDV